MVNLAKSIAEVSIVVAEVETTYFTSETTCGFQDRAFLSFDQSAVPFANQVLHELLSALSSWLGQLQHLRRSIG